MTLCRPHFFIFLFTTFALLFAAAIPLRASADIATGLIGHWKFDETIQGATSTDSGANGYDGTPQGTGGGPTASTTIPSLGAGTTTRSSFFDGSSQYISMGTASGLSTTTFSLSVWIYPTTNSANNYAKIVMQKGTGATNGGYAIEYDSNDTSGLNQPYGVIWNSSDTAVRVTSSNTTAMELNRWHHVVFTYSGGTGALYIDATDGVADGTASNTLAQPSSRAFTVGRKIDESTGYFTGGIDDLRYYNRVLSSAEIAALATQEPSTAPTTAASAVAFSSVAQTSATVSWTSGNGASRAVFMKAASSGSSTPVDSTTYTASTAFGSGTQIGSSGWYTVYNGTGSSVSVTGLSASTTYSVHVVEYNGSAGTEGYATASGSANPAATTTLAYSTPTTAASNASVGNISGRIGATSWTSGNGSTRVVFMKEGATSGEAAPVDNTTYTASATFGSGTQIGSSGWYAVYNSTGSSVNVSGLDSTKSYRVHVVEYNGSTGSQKYFTTAGSGNPANKSAYAGATLYSNYTSGNDTTGDGSSGTPYKTFHKAYSMAIDGDTLDLTGTFTWTNADETGDASGIGYTISKSNLIIRGQGAGTTTIQAAATAGSADRRAFLINTSASTTIRSLTVRYGNTTAAGSCFYVNTSASLTIESSDISYCRSTGSTAAIFASNAGTTLTIRNSSLANNSSATYAGALYFAGTGSTFTLTNSTVVGNTVTSGSSYSYGNAIGIDGGTSYITNTTVTGNYGAHAAVRIGSGTHNFKNTIVSGNTTTGGTSDRANLYRFSGTLTSNGYNIFGIYNTSSLTATTTGDWTDRTGSGTYTLYSAGTTGTFSLAASSTSANGTVASALESGSIGIDHATTTAHGNVSIPTTDQRGYYRSGATDIGAYEYGGTSSSDTTAPSVSLTLPDDGASIYGSAIGISATASDDTSVAGVKFYLNNILVGSEDTSSPYSIVWNSLSATTSGSKTVVAVARDSSNNYATSSSRTVTLSNQPSPSSLSYAGATTTATVTWSTPVEGSSRMFFGFTSALASSTPEQNTSSRVTSHSIDVSNLPACTVFKYQTVSKNELSEIATSSQSTFKTAGCSGSASILANNEDDITTASGGTLTQGVLSLTVPTSFTSTSSTATFQAKKLDGSTFFSNITGPSDKSRATTTVYNLSAYTDTSTTLSTFSSPLTVTFSYADSDVSGLDESSLKIYRYDSSTWSALSSCSVNTSANTVSCTTTQFSDFGIFGDQSSSGSSSSSSGGGGVVIGCTDPKALNYSPYAFGINTAACQYAQSLTSPNLSPSTSALLLFARDLSRGMSGEDVKTLQIFLIERGHSILAGATGYFGPQTQNTLTAFQATHGISPATGYFGPKTRSFMNGTSQTATGTILYIAQASAVFIRDLKRGDVGDDVKALQGFLIHKSVGPVARALAEADSTGFFGTLTKNALVEFQRANNISPATGYFGPKTRALVRNLKDSN